MSRRLLFKIATIALALAVPLSMAGLFGLYRVLTASIRFCGSYGQLDDELGWRLRSNAASCMSLRDRIRGIVFFDSTVFTNDDGFRSREARGASPRGAVAAIGDSWTFGYAINYEQAFPAQLSRQLELPVINMGVPGYGSAATLLLFKRHAATIEPRIVVQFNPGFWGRSLCDPEAARSTLIPCYSWSPNKREVELVVPLPGAVTRAAERGEYPGGALTAGYDSYLSYLFFTRIPESFRSWRRGPRADPTTDVGLRNRVLTFELREYAKLAAAGQFVFVLIDPIGYYAPAVSETAGDWSGRLLYVGAPDWKPVTARLQSLPLDATHVPRDGHYTEEGSRIIADGIAQALTADSRTAEALAGVRRTAATP